MSQPVISEDVRATNRPETWVNLDLTTGLFLMLITSGILVLVWWLVTWPGFLTSSVAVGF